MSQRVQLQLMRFQFLVTTATSWVLDKLVLQWLHHRLFKKLKSSGRFYKKILLPVSHASYGIYLIHLLILVPICGAFRNWLGSGSEGILGFWTTPVEIMASSIAAFIATSAVSVVLRKIPKIGKYIV